MRKPMITAALALAAGCATTGATPAREFTGNPYTVKDEGDRITGLVCGVAIDYTVDHYGSRTVLGGYGRPAHLEVKREGDARHIVGTLGTRVGADEVDMVVAPTRVTGRAGLRDFNLEARGDLLYGTMATLHVQGFTEATVEGRSELANMPDETVAAVLPTLLSCDHGFGTMLQHPPLYVRLGGPAGFEPRENNSER